MKITENEKSIAVMGSVVDHLGLRQVHMYHMIAEDPNITWSSNRITNTFKICLVVS